MALLFCESFDNTNFSTTSGSKWTALSLVSLTTGRFGSGVYFGSTGATGKSANKAIPATSTVITGCSFFYGGGGNNQAHIFFLAADIANQVYMRINTNHTVTLENGHGVVLATSTVTLPVNYWFYLEIKVFVHDTTGTVELRVNGVNIASATNVDTKGPSAHSTISAVHFQTNGTGPGTLIADDVYILDDVDSGVSGAPNNDFLGDIRVESLLPTGNGNSSQFDGSDGNSTDNYLLVDETSPNSDTDYVESGDVGDKDTYAFGNLTPTAGTIYGVQITPFARKTDAGTRQIATVARLSGTETDGPNQTLSTTYASLPDIRQAKPGGGQWALADVNSAEFGVKVTT